MKHGVKMNVFNFLNLRLNLIFIIFILISSIIFSLVIDSLRILYYIFKIFLLT